jgi:hypothetical protein
LITLVAVVPHKDAKGYTKLKGWRAGKANAFTVTLMHDYETAADAMRMGYHAFGHEIVWGIEGDVRA